jgi:hypothetical protein
VREKEKSYKSILVGLKKNIKDRIYKEFICVGRAPWLKPVNLATQEAEIKTITV